MAVVGFNFTKMLAERKISPKGEIKVNINLAIKDIFEEKLDLGKKKQSGLRYTFEFQTMYAPNIGTITLTGNIIDIQDNKIVQAILKDWKNKKKLDDEKTLAVYNTALNKCSIQAILLSKEMGLPSPIPLLKKAVPQAAKKK